MREYFRKPNVAKSYSDMLDGTSEKQMQVQSNIYKHSELKKPYESSSYDDMEQMWQPDFKVPRIDPWHWDYPKDKGYTGIRYSSHTTPGRSRTTSNAGGVDTTYSSGNTKTTYKTVSETTTYGAKIKKTYYSGKNKTIPGGGKKTCFDLWKSLFGNWAGGFIDSAAARNVNEYAKQCPVIFYPPEDCCKGTSISSSNKFVKPANTPSGCTYSWTKKFTGKVGNTCTYKMEARTIWNTKPCATKTVSGPCGDIPTYDDKFIVRTVPCGGESIGYVSQQMGVNDVQPLTVVDPVPGGSYTWEVASGGGSITSDGVYTAPASNAECAGNPTISLLCNGVETATLQLAVNAGLTTAAFRKRCSIPLHSPHPYAYCCSNRGRCSGSYIDATSAICLEHCGVASGGVVSYNECAYGGGEADGIYDVRTPAQKTAGCCPMQLL
uniref:Uncharacterized protein n=1 Tax=viral metagenome TaxID=1070528 RepID=A0A6M3J3X4_9ZZZZ